MVNMALAGSYPDLYYQCVKFAHNNNKCHTYICMILTAMLAIIGFGYKVIATRNLPCCIIITLEQLSFYYFYYFCSVILRNIFIFPCS